MPRPSASSTAFPGFPVCFLAVGLVPFVFMRAVDIILSFPMLILAMALVAIPGVGLVNVVLVTIIVNVAIFARLARSDILAKKQLGQDHARTETALNPRMTVGRFVAETPARPLGQRGSEVVHTKLRAAGTGLSREGTRSP